MADVHNTLNTLSTNVCLGITGQKGKTKPVQPSLGIFHFGSFVVGRFGVFFPFS